MSEKRASSGIASPQSARPLWDFLEDFPLAVLGCTPDGRIAFWNAAAQKLFGWSRRQVLGRPFPIELAGSVPLEEKEGKPFRLIDPSISCPDSRGNIIEVRFWSLGAPPGMEAEGRLYAALEVTEEKGLQRESERRRLLLETILDATADGLLVVAEDGSVLAHNDNFKRIWNLPEEVITSYDDALLLKYALSHLKNPQKFLNRVLELYENPELEGYDVLELIDGRIVERFSRSQAFDGNHRGRVWSFRDVTEQYQAHEALLKSEERYRRFFEDDITGHFISTPAGRLLACNTNFALIMGFSSVTEAMRADLKTLYVEPSGRDEFLEILKRERKLELFEAAYRRNDGKIIHVIENVSGTFDQDGELVELHGFVYDDTSRKLLEEHLRQAQKMEAVGQLAGGIAHDFNNLLTVITGYGEVLAGGVKEDKELSAQAEAILNAARQAGNLTRQLLAFSRRQLLAPRLIDLNAVVNSMERLLERVIGEDVHLETHLERDLWAVKVDPSQMEQVILNLAVNARDAMPDGGTLEIRTRNARVDSLEAGRHTALEAGDFVILEVSDTGHGMDAKTQKRIFEPFFTTKKLGKGTGLGLATVYGIMKQSGGYIYVFSRPGFGTTFRIYLPPIPGGKPRETQQSTENRNPLGSEETVLVVEDEKAIRTLLRNMLENHGYRVLTAPDGQKAFQLSADFTGSIEVLLTDVVMPGMKGQELARRMLQQRRRLKVILMSGYARSSQLTDGSQGGAFTFLQKPFTQQDLLNKLRELLGS